MSAPSPVGTLAAARRRSPRQRGPRMSGTAREAAARALVSIGRAATPAEVAARCGHRKRTVAAALKAADGIASTGHGLWLAAAAVGLDPGALQRFVACLDRCADDTGVIDAAALAQACVSEPWANRVDELAEAAGCVRVFGLWARGGTNVAVAKAAVVHFGGQATVGQVAAATGRPAAQIASAFCVCRSLLRVADRTWMVAPEPALDFEELRASIVLLLLTVRDAGRVVERLRSDMEASAREWTPQTAGEADRDETDWRHTVECFVFGRALARARDEWHREFDALQEECARHLDHGEKERVIRDLLAENGRSIRRRGWGGVTRLG